MGGRRGILHHGVFALVCFSSEDYGGIETYFSTLPLSEGGIKVLPWRGGVNAEGRSVKRWPSAHFGGVSGERLSNKGVIPTKKRV